jgi:hypothetical protein
LKKAHKRTLWVSAFFVLITLVQLFPLSRNPGNAVYDTQDSFLNMWIISWVQTQLFSNPLHLFDGNILYPYRNTLSFSEHLFPQAIFSLPLRWLSGNPVLVYNFVLLFSYFLNAFAMFLFIRFLIGSDLAAIACGIVFAFNSYMLNHVTHIQLLSSGLIPLSLLYFHRFLEDRRAKSAGLFAVFFTLQGLACIYYGLFFLTILILIIPLGLFLYSRPIRSAFLGRLFFPLIASGVVLFIFSLPYLSFMRTFHLDRGAQKGAEIANYFAVSDKNLFLGNILSPLGKHEHWLFPGIVAVALAGYALIRKRYLFRPPPRILRYVFLGLIGLGLLMLAITKISGGVSWRLGILSVSFHNLAKQALLVVVPGITYVVVSLLTFLRQKWPGIIVEEKNLIFYIFMLLWSYLLSLGNFFSFAGDSTAVVPLPFSFFSSFVPGFRGIRVPARYAIFVIFSTAVLAGYGLKYFSGIIKKQRIKLLFAVGLVIFLNLEYISIPFQKKTVPVKEGVPPVYSWLKKSPGRPAVLELPFFPEISDECIYMYFSLSHRKNIMNGCSGFIPLSHQYLIPEIFKNFPSRPCLHILRSLNVKYIVLHMKMWTKERGAMVLDKIKQGFSTDLKLVSEFRSDLGSRDDVSPLFQDDRVFKVVGKNINALKKEQAAFFIPGSDWEIAASHNQDKLLLLRDNKAETKWTAGEPKRNGQFLLVKFRKPSAVSRVSLGLGRFYYGFAEGFRVETSLDGINWQIVKNAYSKAEFTLNIIRYPSASEQVLNLRGEKIRYLRIVQIGQDANYIWTVAEMNIEALAP